MDINTALMQIEPPCKTAVKQAQANWNNIAKPLKSLGLLEQSVIKIAGIIRTDDVRLDKRGVAIMCADNGVVAQGVTQSQSEVTAVVTEVFAKGQTTVCVMARCVNADIVPVDIGVYRDITVPGVINKKIMYGTNDMTQSMAMTREQAVKAVEVGINTVIDLKQQGYNIIITGEMGIGNTTTSAALASLLLDCPVEVVTGYGAGLSNEGLNRKIAVIKQAIALNKPDKNDMLDMLSKVGGLDIAGLVGIYIGGAVCHVPIVMDGVISTVAALIAAKLNPLCKEYMLPSHCSKEPAGALLLEALSFKPLITAEMCLGEGTGGVAALSLIDMALAVYRDTYKFGEAPIEKYKELH